MSYHTVGRDRMGRSTVHYGSAGGARARLVAYLPALLSNPFGVGRGGPLL
jgi:hypothetical protein